jgi:acetyl-CoA acetyltransferase
MPGKVVLVNGVRTAAGKFGHGFKDVPAQRLGAIVLKS